jgi:hypothetical protein
MSITQTRSSRIEPLDFARIAAFFLRWRTAKDREKGVPYLWHSWENRCVKEQAIRTTVDIPASLYRKLKEQAAAQGRSIRELILLGVRVTLIEGKRPRSQRVKFPLIASDGPKVDLTNEQIYEHIEFP